MNETMIKLLLKQFGVTPEKFAEINNQVQNAGSNLKNVIDHFNNRLNNLEKQIFEILKTLQTQKGDDDGK
jgi:DNA anti-recombination protein RmuC